MEVSGILSHHLLTACEQAAAAELPEGWQRLKLDPAKLRQGAALLQEVAEEPTRQRMIDRFEKLAEPPHRSGDQQELKGREERELWGVLAHRLQQVAEARPGSKRNLMTLEVWELLGDHHLRRIYEPFRGLLAQPPPVNEGLATALARILLRARAWHWVEEDRRRAREEAR